MAYISKIEAVSNLRAAHEAILPTPARDIIRGAPEIKVFDYDDRHLQTVHLIEPDLRIRAKMARRLFDQNRHVEIYSDPSELIAFLPKTGIVLVNEATQSNGISCLVAGITSELRDLPLVVYSMKPSVANAVAAMKAHAFNYFDMASEDTCLSSVLDEAEQYIVTNRERIGFIQDSVRRVGLLTKRERQALGYIAQGCTNKDIARQLGLSPRTVEIHRMHMMCKLNAKTCAEAIMIWCAATNVTASAANKSN